MRKSFQRLVAALLCLLMIAGALPLQAFAAEQSLPFTDVKATDYYAKAVEYVYSRSIFKGTSATKFSPAGTMTRGMLVTVLGRLAQVDTRPYLGRTDFTDVDAAAYYAPYVAWAVDNGIASGVGGGRFDPDAPVTRAQIAAFFGRYLRLLTGAGANSDTATLPTDYAAIPDYARENVLLLWQLGLLQGDENGNFNPQQNATRAQVAIVCMRLDEHLISLGLKTDSLETGTKPTGSTSGTQINGSGSGSGSGSDSGSGSTSGGYTITLKMPDGSTATVTQSTATLNLSGLTKPTKDGFYFLGWYYDADCTRQALDGDILPANTTLYPKMLQSGAIETSDTPYYTVKTDVAASGFTVTVTSTSDIDLTNKITITGPEQTDTDGKSLGILTVTKSGNTYTISGPSGKLVAGGTYRIALEDDALRFDEQGDSVREYHFTVAAGTPVMNLHLKDSVKEISVAQISNGTQIAAQNLSPVSMYAGSQTAASTQVSDTTGSFTYTGEEELNIGDTLAIYEGTTKPDERQATSDDLNDVSYVTITGKTGTNTYTYTAASTEDVVFTPDVLAVKSEYVGQSGTTTIPADKLTFANTLAGESTVDSTATVDPGDFLAFYEGDNFDTATSVTYGCITAVTQSSGGYTISYRSADKDEVLASMDVTTQNNVSGDELLGDITEDELKDLEDDIAQQAIDSGFAQAVAQNYAAAISTMDLSGAADGELDLSGVDLSGVAAQDLSFGALQSAPVATYAGTGVDGGNSGPEVEVKVKDVSIDKQLQHFSGLSGVRIALTLEVTIEFDAGEEGENLTITLTPTFVQELRLSISTKGGAKWKWKWIFPYIYDFYAQVSVDMYTYTSINLNATITTGSEGDTVSKVQELVDKLKGGDDEIAEGITELQDLYCNMLETDTEWITLYRKSISSNEWVVAKIIKINLDVDFVVQANVNISLGLEFDYENAKRYIYTIYIFHGKATSDTINLVTESYNLQLYAMGVLGLRAGVETCLSVSLISKKVASVGVVVNVGAYLKVYGYVVYSLHHVAGQSNTSSGSGALYIEVGCYLDIGLDISAFAGKLSWTPTLYSKEWALWSAGSWLAVSGFAAAPDEADEGAEPPKVYMRKAQTTANIPTELLTMAGFDMRTGKDATVAYDRGYFDISFSDSRFSLNQYGQVVLNFGNGVTWSTYDGRELECDMTITWKGAPLSFNSETMQLKTKVHWDQYSDYCSVVFDVQGANQKIANQKLKSTDTLTLPTMTDANRPGYRFLGWKVERVQPDGSLVTYQTGLKDGSVSVEGYDLRLTAEWEAKTNIAYTIIPRLQQPSGTYDYLEGEPYTQNDGRVDTYIIPTLNDIDGYVTPGVGGYYIKADGSTTIRVNYTRKFCTVKVDNQDAITGLAYRYGDKLAGTIPTPTRDGCTFKGWTVQRIDYDANGIDQFTDMGDTIPLTMPAFDLKLTANWERNTNTPYTVNIWKEQTDGSYELAETLANTSGTTDATATPGTDFTLPSYEGYTVNNGTATITIKGNGTAVGNYYYDLNKAELTIYHTAGDHHATETVQCSGLLPASTQTFAGYSLEGYYRDSGYITAATYPTTLTTSETLYAKWTANTDTAYTVELYLEDTNDSFPETANETTPMTGTTDTWVEKTNAPTKTGYEVRDFTRVQINGDGSTVVQFKYYRVGYTLTLNANGGTGVSGGSVKYGTVLNPGTPTRRGYTFGGWYTDSALNTPLEDGATMPAEALTLYAKWTANSGIGYTVKHLQQNVTGTDYVLYETDTSLTGTAGAQTAAAAKTYEGFTAQTITQQTIAGDGTTVVEIKYDRNQYTLTYDLNAQGADFNSGTSNTVTAYYGATISLPTAQDITYTGHSLEGWYTDAACTEANKVTSYTMSAESGQTLYAKWSTSNTSYKVNVYLQNIADDEYTLSTTDSYSGNGAYGSTAPAPQAITGFTAPAASTATLSMNADDNVIEYRYTRNSYTLTWDAQNDEAASTAQVKYGATITAPTENPTRTGYTFDGWYTDSEYKTELNESFTMPADSQTIYAKWTPITYTLRFDADGNVPLKNWLISVGGKEKSVTADENHGIPYIDIDLTYDQTLTFPAADAALTVGGVSYTFADIGVTDLIYSICDAESGYIINSESLLGQTVSKLSSTDGDIVTIDIRWKTVKGDYENATTQSNPALIYNYSQLHEVLVSNSYENPYSKLMVDLEVNNQSSPPYSTFSEASDGCFDGNNHTIKTLTVTSCDSGILGGLAPCFGDNFTVKNLTLDGVTINFSGAMSYGAYGGLIGSVGKNFTMENVTVKNVDMTLGLSAGGSYTSSTTRIKQDCVGGLIGYAAGTVTLTKCSINGLTITTTGNTPTVGSLIGYVDALNESTFDTVNGGNTWTFTDATVTLTSCTATSAGSWNQIGGTYTGTDATVTVPDGATGSSTTAPSQDEESTS